MVAVVSDVSETWFTSIVALFDSSYTTRPQINRAAMRREKSFMLAVIDRCKRLGSSRRKWYDGVNWEGEERG